MFWVIWLNVLLLTLLLLFPIFFSNKSEIFYEDLIKILMADRLLNNEDEEIPIFEVKER